METLKKESHQIFLRELKLMKSKQKQKEIIAIKSIQKDYILDYWSLFVFQIKSKLYLTKLWSPRVLSAWKLVISLTT